VVRAIDEATGTTGAEILEIANLDEQDLLNIVQMLVNLGAMEAYHPGTDLPMQEEVTLEMLRDTRFELNPSFSQEIREAMRRT